MKKIIATPNGVQEFDLTSEEVKQRQLDEKNYMAEKIAREEKIAQEEQRKQSAISKLKAIGLTDEEINSLLGK